MERIVSGIKPSGDLTLGNYVGAIQQFVQLQNTYEMIIFIADMHAITVAQDPQSLYKYTRELVATYVAAGLDPKKVTIFKQSDISQHAELGWVFQCMTYFGELSRMTQFKDKASKDQMNGVTGGLFAYPDLMAADILLYDPTVIPVGEDQTQHVELTRLVAERFNKRYGDTFVLPKVRTVKHGARIMSLQNPEKKMSKSEADPKGTILLLEPTSKIRKKIMSAVTDSDAKIYYDPENKPGLSNLLTIMSSLTERSIDDIVNEFESEGYGTFKKAVADIVCEHLETLQEKVKQLLESNEIDNILAEGKAKALPLAQQKIDTVYQKIGFRKGAF